MSMDEEPATVYVNNDKISVKMCRICLRSDNVIAKSIDDRLLDFYNEITDVNVFAHPMLSFCPLCEYKLRKFYNFKQRCLRSNYILKRKITNAGHMDLGSLPNLIPRDLGFSMPNDRRGLFEYKCHLFMAEQNSMTETKLQTNIFKIDGFKTEVMVDTDLIKTEVDRLLEDPIKNTDNDFILEKRIDKIQDEMDIDASVIDESIENDASDFNYLNDDSQDSNYLCDSDLSEDEMPIRKNKNTKKGPLKTHLSGKKTHKQINIGTRHEKITAYQLAALLNEPYNINNINYADLMCMRKSLSHYQKNKLDFRLKIEHLKQRCLNLLDEGKIDLGEVKLTKEMFLELFAKCDTSYIKLRGYATQMENIPKLKNFMLYLHRRYNPEYETIFHVEYLNTDEKKLQEFNRRKDGRSYKEAPYKCELCYKGFEVQRLLDFHNKWHNVTPNDIVCNICPMRFVSKSTYKVHRTNNHTVVYTCRQCPVVTYHFSVMLNHYNQHKGVEYHCPICLSVYANKTTLNNHRREVHATSHICTACARAFVSENGLFFHKKYKHKGEVAADPADATLCTECNITFDSHAVYLRHARTAHKQRHGFEFKCFYCKECFDSIEALRQHKVELNHLRAPKQMINRKSVGTEPSGAKRSSRTQVSDLKKPYRKCPVCQVKVPNSCGTSMYVHYQKVHPNVPYDSLHKDSKEFLCEECGKTFKCYSHYLDHKNQHTGAKPYACKECPAQFATKKHLVYHSDRHRSPRYQCKQCGKMFLSAANLFAHRRTHTGERRVKCKICFKGFLHTMALNEHIKGVHNRIRRVRKVPLRDKNKHQDPS